MRLDSIVDAYEPIANLPRTAGLATQRMLALIAAADTCDEPRRSELLNAAGRLNEWLLRKASEKEIRLINRWQIAARRGSLTPQRRTEIRGLRRQIARTPLVNADQLEPACALLLGDGDEIEDLIDQIPASQVKEMQGWPNDPSSKLIAQKRANWMR